MMRLTAILAGAGFLFGLGAAILFFALAKSGQFDDIEEVKYRMLEDDKE